MAWGEERSGRDTLPGLEAPMARCRSSCVAVALRLDTRLAGAAREVEEPTRRVV